MLEYERTDKDALLRRKTFSSGTASATGRGEKIFTSPDPSTSTCLQVHNMPL